LNGDWTVQTGSFTVSARGTAAVNLATVNGLNVDNVSFMPDSAPEGTGQEHFSFCCPRRRSFGHGFCKDNIASTPTTEIGRLLLADHRLSGYCRQS
jgi:hypothetical protein